MSGPEKAKETEPVTQSVVVECPIEDAFDLFTSRIGEWWPSGDGPIREIEPRKGGRVDGDERPWGIVNDWDPPNRLSFANEEESVEVTFLTVADGTRVTVVHRLETTSIATCFASFVCQSMVAV